MSIEVGQEAPDFTLKNAENEDVSLSDFRGERSVVLLFYPAAFSGVCTTQLTALSAEESRLAGADAQVLGISVDGRFAQGAFARSLGLEHTVLLADFEPKGEVARRYGVYAEERGTATRSVFVIDRDGIVRHAEVAAPGEIPDPEGYFAALAACTT